MKAKSIKGTSVEEIKTAIQQSMADARLPDGQGFKPTLAFVFCSLKQDPDAICAILENEHIAIFGASSSGEFIDGYQGEGSVVILLLDIKPEHFTILFEEIGSRNVRDVARQMGEDALRIFKKPAFILTANGDVETDEPINGEMIVRGIEAAVGPDVSISGGTAGNDMQLTGTRIFMQGRSSNRGVMALVLDEEKIEMHGLAISGWQPVGTTKTVTKSEGGWIYSIDGKPALEIFLNYMGKPALEGNAENKNFYQLGSTYPLQIQKESGNPAMCAPAMFNKEEGSLLCEFNLPVGTKFRFSLPPDFDIIEEVLAQSAEVKSANHASADALLIFSCLGRLMNLGPLANEELEGLKNIWGVPMAGFYCYGEFGRTKNDRQDFHSTTISWAVLKEK